MKNKDQKIAGQSAKTTWIDELSTHATPAMLDYLKSIVDQRHGVAFAATYSKPMDGFQAILDQVWFEEISKKPIGKLLYA